MAGDLVTAGRDLTQLVRVTIGPPAHDEEGGVQLAIGERVEDGGGRFVTGADVEDERHVGECGVAMDDLRLGDRHARGRGLGQAAGRQERHDRDDGEVHDAAQQEHDRAS